MMWQCGDAIVVDISGVGVDSNIIVNSVVWCGVGNCCVFMVVVSWGGFGVIIICVA